MMRFYKSFSLCLAAFLTAFLLGGCTRDSSIPDDHVTIENHEFLEREQLKYADKFAIDRYTDGFSAVYTAAGTRCLIVPRGESPPENLNESYKIIYSPIENVYLAATSSMSLFDALDSGSAVRFSGTKAEDWYIDYAKNALESGSMIYAGKYSLPDYELLLSNKCSLAIESTMIEHTPDVKEKLEELGITVFVDYSSYEQHPLGRSEWIKVYGEMLGKSDIAESAFNEQSEMIENLKKSDTNKTAVFFYINSSGQFVTRKPGDYVSKMIELSGGENVFKHLDGEGFSTVTLEGEEFCETARDADFIIYNSTIGGEVQSIEQLCEKSPLLEDFKAVRENNVWCTKNNLFQETLKSGSIILEMNLIFTNQTEGESMEFLFKLKGGGENER